MAHSSEIGLVLLGWVLTPRFPISLGSHLPDLYVRGMSLFLGGAVQSTACRHRGVWRVTGWAGHGDPQL